MAQNLRARVTQVLVFVSIYLHLPRGHFWVHVLSHRRFLDPRYLTFHNFGYAANPCRQIPEGQEVLAGHPTAFPDLYRVSFRRS